LPETPPALVPQNPATGAPAQKAIRLEGVVRLGEVMARQIRNAIAVHDDQRLSTTAKGHNFTADAQ
jgi:hypothetical protein